ncbi:DUF6449 domain-containing protein [Harryflintia acetispora]|uniref:ABC-type transport system involved in multi-copper enzyme maturation permease subunit n=1 Tax=Harryflintia acetispora TaxID=1849041 RepID=A0A9X8UJF1_9FIRM|nr:DUF6449 domain-containing protein [Harryflintia acetispora]TCL43689.1 ABC-type transport system involved in multi-copper enzyme maturation permease subunit [Harryflintia acetispora]
MITTTSSSNRGKLSGLYLSILRRNFGVTLLYFIFQFLFFPLQYILSATDALKNQNAAGRIHFIGMGGIYTGISLFFFTAMVIVAPILFTMMQYSFLHQKRSTDLFHALPIRREQMLLVNFAASATMILVPMALNYAVTIIAAASFGFPGFSLLGALADAFSAFCLTLGLLAVTTLVSVSTGTVFDNLVYTVGLLFGVPSAIFLCLGYAANDLFGCTLPDWSQYLFLASPATAPAYLRIAAQGELEQITSTPGFLLGVSLGWLALAGIFLLVDIGVYRRRGSELAGKTGYSSVLTQLVKLTGALIGGVCFTLLVRSVANSEGLLLSAVSAAVGGALIYCVAECVMSRGFKTIKTSAPYLGAGLALPVLFVLMVGLGWFGYEGRVPTLDKIESVEINFTDRYGFTHYDFDASRKSLERMQKNGRNAYDYYSLETINEILLADEKARELVHDIHQDIVNGHEQEEKNVSGAYITLEYKLKSGGSLKRSYYGMPLLAGEKYNELNACEEVKVQTHPVYSLKPSDVREITLLNRLMGNVTPVSFSEGQIGRLIEALREDMSAETYEQMENGRELGYLVLTPKYGAEYFSYTSMRKPGFVLPDESDGYDACYVLLTENYESTLALLGEFGYDGFERVDYDNIERAYITLDAYYNRDNVMRIQGPYGFDRSDLAQNEEMLSYNRGNTEITDPAVLRILAEAVRGNAQNAVVQVDGSDKQPSWGGSITLMVTFVSKDGSNLIHTFAVNPKVLPEATLLELKDSFNRQWSDENVEDPFTLVLERIRSEQ